MQICHNSQEYPTLYWNGIIMSKGVGELCIKEFFENLFTSQTIQKR